MINLIGGSGFIGTRLCKRLQERGLKFTIIDKTLSKTFAEVCEIADVRNLEDLRKTCNGDVIINLAAEHRDDVTPRSLYYDVNVKGAENVCNVAREKEINKIIFTSSVAVYGFAPLGTDESGALNPFNEYGRTKMLAEEVYKKWQSEDPHKRCLVIIRPTVVFGEGNRGNVYNLLKQIASGRFIMVGDGTNIKSMAYVENVAAFIEHSLNFGPGIHIYNYVDKPDFDMNTLVSEAYRILGKSSSKRINFRLPYSIGYAIGKLFDFAAFVSGNKFSISSIRIKKFCSNSCFNTSISVTGFVPPVSIREALQKTIRYEFIDKTKGELFYTE